MLKKYTTGDFETNSYLIYNEKNEAIIIDCGLDYKSVALEIKESYDVKAIFLTHGHVDHIDGIKYFPNIKIYISGIEEKFLYDSSYSLYNFTDIKSPYKRGDLDVSLVNDGDIIDIIGKKVLVTSTPGHTKGSVCYSYQNKLFSGDTLFKESEGRCDLPTGNERDIEKSLKKISEKFNDLFDVYPGHGPKTTMKYERQNNFYLIEAMKR